MWLLKHQVVWVFFFWIPKPHISGRVKSREVVWWAGNERNVEVDKKKMTIRLAELDHWRSRGGMPLDFYINYCYNQCKKVEKNSITCHVGLCIGLGYLNLPPDQSNSFNFVTMKNISKFLQKWKSDFFNFIRTKNIF